MQRRIRNPFSIAAGGHDIHILLAEGGRLECTSGIQLTSFPKQCRIFGRINSTELITAMLLQQFLDLRSLTRTGQFRKNSTNLLNGYSRLRCSLRFSLRITVRFGSGQFLKGIEVVLSGLLRELLQHGSERIQRIYQFHHRIHV